jgi:hypothetical protein
VDGSIRSLADNELVAQGELLDSALLPSAQECDDGGDECGSDGRFRPTEVDLRGCQLEHQDVLRLSRALAGNVRVLHPYTKSHTLLTALLSSSLSTSSRRWH